MEKVSRVSIGVLSFFLLLPRAAHALDVSSARLQDGQVRVIGKGAAKDAPIYWQDVAVTTSTGGGSFAFTSPILPATCVGKLSDGVTTLFIAVSGCSASGVTVPSTVALVAATGQTTSYAIGDDGFHQVGVPLPSPRFTDNLNGTISDNLTELIWLKDASCLGRKPWLGALAAVDGLQEGLCGLSDGSTAGAWRLPNRNELRSLESGGAGLDWDHPFIEPEDLEDYLWSSTTYPFDPTSAWTLRAFRGNNEQRSEKALAHGVIAVRGGS